MMKENNTLWLDIALATLSPSQKKDLLASFHNPKEVIPDALLQDEFDSTLFLYAMMIEWINVMLRKKPGKKKKEKLMGMKDHLMKELYTIKKQHKLLFTISFMEDLEEAQKERAKARLRRALMELEKKLADINDLEERIKIMREKKKISIQQLAMEAGLTREGLYRLEGKKTSPTLKTLEKISDAMDEPLVIGKNEDNLKTLAQKWASTMSSWDLEPLLKAEDRSEQSARIYLFLEYVKMECSRMQKDLLAEKKLEPCQEKLLDVLLKPGVIQFPLDREEKC